MTPLAQWFLRHPFFTWGGIAASLVLCSENSAVAQPAAPQGAASAEAPAANEAPTATPDPSASAAPTSAPTQTPPAAAPGATPTDPDAPRTPPSSDAEAAPATDVPLSPDAPSEALNAADPNLAELRALSSSVLSEGAKDLGMALAREPETQHRVSESALLLGEPGTFRVAAELNRTTDGGLLLRLVAVAPGQTVLQVRRASVTADTLEVTLLRMLRDLQKQGAHAPAVPDCPVAPAIPQKPKTEESDGRAYVAVNGALVGGYAGFALEHIAGSSDARLIYPLMTVGAGVGVGASLVAADEWRITTGEAWFLSAGTLWSTSSSLLLSDGLGLQRSSARHAYGLLGTTLGLSLGTLAISTSEIDQGDALFTHSGAVFGGLFGALTQRLIEPNLQERQTLGLGAGLGAGTLVAGLLATQLETPAPERMVYIDLSAFLGALTGAAAASPVLVGNTVDETETRLFIGSVFAGSLLGGFLGYALTDAPKDEEPVASQLSPTLLRVDFGQPYGERPWAVGVSGTF